MKKIFVIPVLAIYIIPCGFAADQNNVKYDAEQTTQLQTLLDQHLSWKELPIKKVLSHVRAGANPNNVLLAGEPILHKACENDDAESVALLLQHKADPNSVSSGWGIFTPIIRAESEQVLQLLVDHGANLNWHSASGKRGLLHHLASPFKRKSVALLRKCCYELGCNVHALTRTGETPLYEVCEQTRGNAIDCWEKICILLNVGAQLRHPSAKEITPLDLLEKNWPSLVAPALALETETQQARATRAKELSACHDALAAYLQSPNLALIVTDYSHEIVRVPTPELTEEQKVRKNSRL